MRVFPGRGPRIALAIGGLLLLQGVALLGHRALEDRRSRAVAAFRFERIEAVMPAPELVLERPDGARVAIAPGREGEAMLVHFWATWCPPCRQELPALLALGRRLSPTGRVRVVAIATDTSWSEIRRFFKGAIPAEVLRDATGRVHQAFRVSSLPDTYLVTADGLIRIRFAGAQDWGSKQAHEFLSRELTELIHS